MRNIARRLLGPEAERLFDLFEPDDGRRRVRESAEWCQSTPGHGAPDRLGFALRAKGRPGRRRGPRSGDWCE